MTLPASGTITMANFSVELGLASTANNSMSFVYSKAKTGQQSYAMNAYYSKAYYQQNTAGNCSNGNCATGNCNCGDINCVNCYISGTVNCTNCDATSYLQTNCNCACTYNCTQGVWSRNCSVCTTCDCGNC